MVNIKGLVLAGITASTLLISSASAENRTTFMMGFGGSEYKFKNASDAKHDINAYRVGFGYDHFFDNNVMVGIDQEFSWGKLQGIGKNVKVFNTSVDFKGGYRLFNSGVTPYALVGAGYDIIEGGIHAYGVGYGAGIEYEIAKQFVLDAKYKKESMKGNKLVDYHTNRLLLSAKYIF